MPRGVTALLRLIAVLIALAAPVWAQGVDDDTLTEWNDLATRVQRVLEYDRANEATLVRIRGEVASYRDRFLTAQGANSDRVARIERQLGALGPAPGEGETEDPELAERRQVLNDELTALRRPVLRANEAFIEADGLVAAIDRDLRDRSARQVLKRYPYPFNPAHWQQAFGEMRAALVRIPQEVADTLNDPDGRQAVNANLPSVILSVIGGVFLLFRSRIWLDRAIKRFDGSSDKLLQKALQLVLVLAQFVLPWSGLILLLAALQLTGLFGETGRALALSLATFGFSMIAGTWLIRQLYPRHNPGRTPLRLPAKLARRGRIPAQVMVVALSAAQGMETFADKMNFDPQSSAYLGLLLSLITAVALFRTMQLYRRQPDMHSVELPEYNFADSVLRVLSSLAILLCIVGPVAGALGYVVLTKKLIFPAAATYLLFGFLALTQRTIREFHAMFRARSADAGEQEGLLPTMVGAALILMSVPVLALLWGARVTDLTEVWTKIREGFVIGDVQISPSEFITFAIVFAVGYGFTRLIQGALRNTVLPKTKLDQGARTAIVSGLGYIGVFVAGVLAVTTAGIDLSAFAIFASALAVGIGFGLQTIVSNFVSGIILLIERPVSEGDWIEVGGQMGYVRRIAVRATRIETFDRTDVIVPNADLVSGQVTNWTRGNLIGRVIVPVGVAYGTDTRKVEKILLEIANAHPLVVVSPPPTVLFIGFGADSLDFEIRAILRDVNYVMSVKSDMNHDIVRRFTEEGIEIPFAQRDVWLRNPEALSPPALPPGAPEPVPPPQLRQPDNDGDAT